MKKLIVYTFFIAGFLCFKVAHPMQTKEEIKKEKDFIDKYELINLFKAIKQYSVDAFKKYLKDNNINSNAEVQQGYGNLLGAVLHHLIAVNNISEEQYKALLGMLEFLLNTGAEVNSTGYKDHYYTPLMLAVMSQSVDAVKIFLAQKNIDLNKQDPSKRNFTALHYAVNGNPEIVKLLLQAGADQTIKTDKRGNFENPLEYAQSSLKVEQDNTKRLKLEKIIDLLKNQSLPDAEKNSKKAYSIKHQKRMTFNVTTNDISMNKK